MLRKSLWSAMLLCSLFASGQDLNIDSVTINANRMDQKITELGKSVTILNAEDIENIPVNTVDQLLRYVAGINLNSRGPFGVQTDIGMRGSTFSQVVILIDNVRLNDPLTAHFNNNIPVAMAEIARIEVIRGPSSAAYGSDAVGGIIHIKTKTYLLNNDSTSYSEGSITAGKNKLTLADIGIVGGKNKLRYSAGLKASSSEGRELLNPNYPAIASADSLFRDRFDIRTFSASISYKFNDAFRLQLRSGVDQRDFNAKYYYTASAYDESVEEIESMWTQLSLFHQGSKHSTEWNLAHKNTNDVFDFNPLFAANEHNTKKIYSNINHQWKLDSKFTWAFGMQTELKTIESTDRGDHEQLSNGIYTILNAKLGNFHPTASLRMEYDESFGTELIPQFSASYNHRSQVFRLAVGKAIRAADFTERFISFNIDSLLPGRNAGNPDLEAERSYTADLGYDLYLNNNMTFTLNAYSRWSTNLIDYAITNSNNISNLINLYANENYLYATNISEASTQGIEFIFSHKLKLNELSINYGLNYSFIKTESKDSVVSKYIANHPNHIININCVISYREWSFELINNATLRESEQVEAINANIPASYDLLQLRLSYAIDQDELVPFVQVYNALDTDYQEILGAQMPGRMVLLGFKWRI